MRLIRTAVLLVCLGVLQVARAEAPGEVNQLEASVRAIVNEQCGSCHDGARSTAKPAALKVFDLQEADWTARMSDDQLKKVVDRVKGKDLSLRQQGQVAQLMKKKLKERGPNPGQPKVPPPLP